MDKELEKINQKIKKLRKIIIRIPYIRKLNLLGIKSLMQINSNFNNEIHYLVTKYFVGHKGFSYKKSVNKQNTVGLDYLDEKHKIAVEVKTTNPCKDEKLGSRQKEYFEADFEKLKKIEAKKKYFVVTNANAKKEADKIKLNGAYEDINIINIFEKHV